MECIEDNKKCDNPHLTDLLLLLLHRKNACIKCSDYGKKITTHTKEKKNNTNKINLNTHIMYRNMRPIQRERGGKDRKHNRIKSQSINHAMLGIYLLNQHHSRI